MTNHLLPPRTTIEPATDDHARTEPFAPPTAPSSWAAPRIEVATSEVTSPVHVRPRSGDHRGRLAAVLGIVTLSVVGVVASVAARSADAPRVLATAATDTTDTTDTVPASTTTEPTTTEPTTTEPTTTEPTTTEPIVVLPTDTAAPATPSVAHSLAAVVVGDCLRDGALAPCDRGADVVTLVATDASQCVAGETSTTVTESNAVPSTVTVCTVPAHLDDRTLLQAFTIDESCVAATADEMLSLEVETLVCTSDAGAEYVLVKVAEGQMVTYLTDVLAAEFVGDFTTTDGDVCGGHYRIDGWDAFVFGYGPFVEFRQHADTDGVRFSRSLCAV